MDHVSDVSRAQRVTSEASGHSRCRERKRMIANGVIVHQKMLCTPINCFSAIDSNESHMCIWCAAHETTSPQVVFRADHRSHFTVKYDNGRTTKPKHLILLSLTISIYILLDVRRARLLLGSLSEPYQPPIQTQSGILVWLQALDIAVK